MKSEPLHEIKQASRARQAWNKIQRYELYTTSDGTPFTDPQDAEEHQIELDMKEKG